MRRAWLISLLLLAGCDSGTAPVPEIADKTSYFPLSEGSAWAYQVTTETDGKITQSTQRITTLPPIQHEGRTVHVRRSEQEANIGVEYWLKADASGIRRIAHRTDSYLDVVMDAAPRTVLKMPLKRDATWTSPTVTYSVLRNVDFSRKAKEAAGMQMTHIVEAVDQKVTVPAGTFEQCIRIKGRGEVTLDMGQVRVRSDDTLYTDATARMRRVPIVHTEWYCQGVGLVKVERLEPITLSFSNADRIVLELTDYTVR